MSTLHMKRGTMRIIVMGTPDFAVPSLQAIAAMGNGFDIVLVVTGQDKPRKSKHAAAEASPIKQAALALNLPVHEVDDVNDPHFAEIVAAYKPDVIVVAAFRILPPAVYSQARLGAFNLHASLLPAYRGAAPVNWAIMNGEEETGVTTFFLQQRVDTGTIIMQQKTAIAPEENATELIVRLANIGADVVVETLRRIAAKNAATAPQDDSLASRAPKLTRINTRINWEQPVATLHNFIRGLALKPSAWTTFNDKTLKIFRTTLSTPEHDHPSAPAGSLLVSHGKLYVHGSDGWLELLALQLEGRKPMEAADFARGLHVEGEALRLV